MIMKNLKEPSDLNIEEDSREALEVSRQTFSHCAKYNLVTRGLSSIAPDNDICDCDESRTCHTWEYVHYIQHNSLLMIYGLLTLKVPKYRFLTLPQYQ